MTNRDDGLSSEELIRRARYGLDVEQSVDAPPAPAAPQADAPVVRQPIRPSAFPGEEPPAGAEEPYGIPSPHNPDADEPYGYVPPPPSKPSSAGVFQRFGGWILIGVLALGGFAWRALSDTKPVEDLTVGECINEPDDEIITSIKTVNCDELHDYEVFQVVQVPYTSDAAYPGDESLFWEVLDICVGYFSGFVGMDYADSIYDINAIYPTQESWDEQNDREATCLIAQYDSIGDILPVTGTLRDVRR